MTDTLFIGNAKTQTMLRDFDRLRKAIREHDPEATEAAWGDCERWVDCINPTAADLEQERLRLSEVLLGIEMLTATGAGLSPLAAIEGHTLAAEGRVNDPHAWRAAPEVIARLRAALRNETLPTSTPKEKQ